MTPNFLMLPSHMIYFRDEGTRLTVIRVLHGRQDVDRHL